MKQDVIDFIKEKKIIAIVRGVSKNNIVKTAEALYQGGICLIEVTFNQNDPEHMTKTPEMIRMIKEAFEGKIRVGAGTVMTVEQCEAAFKAGAEYIIAPNTNCDVIRKANELGMVSIPGAMTPTEADIAYEAGADFVKLYPAGSLGPGYIKALCAPLNHIPFLGVGGIDSGNLKEYMKTGICGVGVGGNLVNTAWINEGKFDQITKNAADYVKVLGQ